MIQHVNFSNVVSDKLEPMKTVNTANDNFELLRLVKAINYIPNKVKELHYNSRVFDMKELHQVDAKVEEEMGGGLYLRQMLLEEEMHNDAVETYTAGLKQLMGMGKGTHLKYIQRVLLKWYEPLVKEIETEIKAVENKIPGMDRSVSIHQIFITDLINFVFCLCF